MSEIKFVKCKDIKCLHDGTIDPDYGYAVCECHSTLEGIQVPRPESTCTVSFECPRCGKKLGLFMIGKKTLQQEAQNENQV